MSLIERAVIFSGATDHALIDLLLKKTENDPELQDVIKVLEMRLMVNQNMAEFYKKSICPHPHMLEKI